MVNRIKGNSISILEDLFGTQNRIKKKNKKTTTGIPCFIALCFITLLRFLQIEGLWQPCLEQVYQCHVPTAFAHFVSLGHILVILAIFQTLHPQKDYELLKAQMMDNFYFSNKVIFN